MVDESTVQLSQATRSAALTWKRAALIACVSVFGILLLFQDTVHSMTATWRTEPYNYGYFIFPISIWLLWDKRRQLARLTPLPEFRVLPLMLLAGIIWLLAHLVYFEFVQQVALISLLILAIWCILGTQVAKALVFPLGFLLLAAPPLFVIEPLYPMMVEFTADFVVRLLELTSIPVYRDDIYLLVPNGSWSVEEQCSGVRYLTSSIIIGCIYAYYFYRKPLRRALFLLLTIVLPIIANSLRAYIIIMIGYLSDMKLAVGVDHILFGSLFFFVVIFLMSLMGAHWWELPGTTSRAVKSAKNSGSVSSDSPQSMRFIGVGLASLLAASIWPGIAISLDPVELPYRELKLGAPAGVDGWSESSQHWLWSPLVRRVDGELHASYRQDDLAVSLYLAQFRRQRRYAEPFGRPNVMIVPEAQSWRNDIRTPKRIALDTGYLEVLHAKTVTVMRDKHWGDLLVWYWYRIGDKNVASPFYAKLLDAWALLTGTRRDIALIALATNYQGDLAASESVLRSFTSSMMAGISTTLDCSLVEDR